MKKSPFFWTHHHNFKHSDTVCRRLKKDQFPATITFITGRMGCGKSTLAKKLYDALTYGDSRTRAVVIDDANHSFRAVETRKYLKRIQRNFHHLILVIEPMGGEFMELIRRRCHKNTQINVINLT